MRLPYATSRIDPHDLFDPLAAVLGSAIADTAYGRDARGVVYPALADGFPFVENGQTAVRLRPGLISARGKAVGGRDLAWSVARARKAGAAALFAHITPWVQSDKNDPHIARFGDVDPKVLALLLTSPLTAVLPVGFDAAKPDGTGAFVGDPSARALVLRRNPFASRGPSNLEQVRVSRGHDLADSLKAFEAGADDVGWLGLGFYGSRPGARPFNYREVGWVVLVTGKSAGALHKPGVAQKLANAVPVESLHVGLSARSGAGSQQAWSGGDAALVYDAGVPQLKEIADVVAAQLSSSGGTITPRPLGTDAVRRLRSTEAFSLALDVVRHPGPITMGPLLALSTAESVNTGIAVAKKPPSKRLGAADTLTRNLHLGVLGGLRAEGGVIQAVLLAPDMAGRGIDWGASYRH
jgi:peptide/nickel transport system substrate-binding protein